MAVEVRVEVRGTLLLTEIFSRHRHAIISLLQYFYFCDILLVHLVLGWYFKCAVHPPVFTPHKNVCNG